MCIQRLLPSITVLASIATFQIAAHFAAAQAVASEQSELSAAATTYWNVSGTWRFNSAGVVGTMKLHQEPSTERCKRLTGIMDVPNDYSTVIGIYCPSSLRIYFGRYKINESTPFQMHEGYVVNGSGKYMDGSFFVWGNLGPWGGRGFPVTLPFSAERLQ
jgi:hypothetical protein